MPQYEFGAGNLYGIVEGANRTPRKFGTLQEVSVDIDFDLKELHGQKKFAVALAQGKGKIACKASAAEIYGIAYAELMFGDTAVTTAQRKGVSNEPGVVPTTPFTVTVVNGATFYDDLGVKNAATGLALTRVASGPTTGQYSVNTTTGVYTFASADVSLAVLIDYSYTPAASGKKFTVSNVDMGTQTFFTAVLTQSYDADGLYMKLFRCVGKKLGFATKLDDWQIPSFEFGAFANAAEQVIEFGVSDQ